MRNVHLKLLFIVALTAVSALAVAQNDTLEIQREPKGKVHFARFAPSQNPKMKLDNSIGFLKSILQVKAADDFKLEKEWKDEYGTMHRKFQQYYKGIRVEYGDYLTHGKDNNIEFINGKFEDIAISTITPALTEKQALGKALKFVNAQKYKWEDAAAQARLQESTKNPAATYYPVGELVICKDFLKGGNHLKLSWKFSIASSLPNDAQLIFVDAATGEIINQQLLIFNTNSPGTAETKYSGTKAITGDSFTGGFRLRESRNGIDVQTLNMQSGSDYGAAVDFVDNDNNWTAAEHANANQDQVALDAHWGAEMVLDYWSTVLSRNSIDGNGMAVRSYVHYSSGWGNAQWNGSAMLYGDGDGSTFRALTSLDVCAHEFGHGICQYTSNLAYVLSESAALNEGFSDIWGATIEAWAAPGKQRWLIGEEITISSPGFLRSMSNPLDGLEGNVDTYSGTNWYTGNSVSSLSHINNGVLNHWYYLLTEGGSGWNNGLTSHAAANNGFAWSVTGIGLTDAAQIAYLTERNLSSDADYTQTRNVSIEAARTLFGNCSTQEIAVTNAWNAVGIGAAFVALTTPSITAIKSSDTGEPTTYLFTATPLVTGGTFNWYSGSSLVQSGSDNTLDYYFPCNVTKTISCTVTNICGTSASSNSISKTGGCDRARIVTITPNPASSMVTVSAKQNLTITGSNEAITEIRIYDMQGILKKQAKYNKVNNAIINVSGLALGIYFVEVTSGSEKSRQQLIIQP